MARGPFQGTFQPNIRPTIVTAPDAMIMINGESDIIGCPSCRRKFDLNAYVTSISVDLSVDSPPGSANINLSVPRHTIDDLFFEGTPIITAMMEVEIFAKGYYLVEGVPQYYPIFWGMVTEVTDDFSGGEHSVTIHCADILKWWELCKMNVNSAWTTPPGQMGRNTFGNVFSGANPYDVIWQLAQHSFGDVVVGTGSLISVIKDQGVQKQVFQAALKDMMKYWSRRFTRIRSNMLMYGVNGVAVRGDTIAEKYPPGGVAPPYAMSTAVKLANGGPNSGQMIVDVTSHEVAAFHRQYPQAGEINLWQTEYQTKLELATACKECLGFEFYMDVTGDLVFKPPFFNMDVLSNKPVSWIQDIDIIEWNFSESEAEVITQLTMQGTYGGVNDYGGDEAITPFTSVTDYHLLRQYGWRSHSYNSEFMGDPNLMFNHGLDMLDRINSKRHRATVGIPLRPELRLGFPVYVASKDQIWYISGISHNISFGGRAQTTLTLTSKRGKFIAPRGIGKLQFQNVAAPPANNKAVPKGQKQPSPPNVNLPFRYSSRQLSLSGSFLLEIGDAAQLPPNLTGKPEDDRPYEPLILRHPKTGRLVGYPNVVMAYTRPFKNVSDDEVLRLGGVGKKPSPQRTKNATSTKAGNAAYADMTQNFQGNTASPTDAANTKTTTNRYSYGMNSAGVYVYAYEIEKVIGEVVIMPSANLKTEPATIAGIGPDGKPIQVKPFPGGSAMIRPVSDERGFEVIGHYRYGRGIALRDGQLVYNNGSKNAKASVDLQVGLSGDLFASLHAQSQGLSAIISAYPNPVQALARLQPSDLETAGITSPVGRANPDVARPQFVPFSTSDSIQDNTNFVDAAPMGSAAQKGYHPSVEASQLSRALTLAEMAVADKDGAMEGTDSACMCIMGRSDLAFINTGYQVKTLKGATPDVSSLFNVNPSFGAPGAIGGSAAQSEAIRLGEPVQPNLTVMAPAEVIGKVDQFLYGLYELLDDAHQPLEAALRGDAFVIGNEREALLNGQAGDNPTSDFTPPFSSVNRSALGDPIATAQQAESSVEGLANQWKNFGNNLKNTAKRESLSGQIALDQKNVARDQAALAKLEASKQNNTSIVNVQGTPTVDQQIATLQKRIADTQQDLANKQAQLAQIPAPKVG